MLVDMVLLEARLVSAQAHARLGDSRSPRQLQVPQPTTALLVMRVDMAQRVAPAANVQETAQLDAMH